MHTADGITKKGLSPTRQAYRAVVQSQRGPQARCTVLFPSSPSRGTTSMAKQDKRCLYLYQWMNTTKQAPSPFKKNSPLTNDKQLCFQKQLNFPEKLMQFLAIPYGVPLALVNSLTLYQRFPEFTELTANLVFLCSTENSRNYLHCHWTTSNKQTSEEFLSA